MEESNAILNARISALEYQRNHAMTEWARDRANLQIAQAAIAEQDALLAAARARIAELEAQFPKGPEDGRTD